MMDILRHEERPSILNLGNVGDAIANVLNRTDPYEREQLIIRTAKKLKTLFEIARSWNSTMLQWLNENSRSDEEHSDLSSSEKVSEEKTTTLSLDMVVHGGMIPVVATLGIILTAGGVYRFLRGPRRAQIYTLLLSTLLTFDAIFLVFEMLKNVELYIFSLPNKYRTLFHVIMNSAIRFSAISSISMLVTISHIRLGAIRKPFRHNSNMLSWKEKRNIWAKHCFPIIIISIMLTIPVFFEFEFSTEGSHKTDSIISPSSMRLHPLYSFLYVGILNFGILGVLPTAYLIYVVYQIRNELKKSNAMLGQFESRRRNRKKETPPSSPPHANINGIENENDGENYTSFGGNHTYSKDTKFEKEIKGLKNMIRVILVFVVLHTFRIITTFGEFYVLLDPNKDDEAIQKGQGVPDWLGSCASLSEMCMVINSFLNGIIYSDVNLKTKLRNFVNSCRKCLRSVTNKQHYNPAIVIDDENVIDVEAKDQVGQKKDSNHLGVQKSCFEMTETLPVTMTSSKANVTSEANEVNICRSLRPCERKYSNPIIVKDNTTIIDIEATERNCQIEDAHYLGAHKRLGISISLGTSMAPSSGIGVSQITNVDMRRPSLGCERKYSNPTIVVDDVTVLDRKGNELNGKKDEVSYLGEHKGLSFSNSLSLTKMPSFSISKVFGHGKVDMRRPSLGCERKYLNFTTVEDEATLLNIEEKDQNVKKDDVRYLGVHKRFSFSRSLSTSKMSSFSASKVFGHGKVDMRRPSLGCERKYLNSTIAEDDASVRDIEEKEQNIRKDDVSYLGVHKRVGPSVSLSPSTMSSFSFSRIIGHSKVNISRSLRSVSKYKKFG